MHQRRAAEALALQRQQVQRMNSSQSVETETKVSEPRGLQPHEVAMEMDRMDRILAENAPPPPPPPKVVQPLKSLKVNDTKASAAEPEKSEESSPTGEFFLVDFPEEDSSAQDSSPQPSPDKGSEDSSVQPEDEDGEGSLEEKSTPGIKTKQIFPHSASPRLAPEKKKSLYNENFPDDLPSRRAKPAQVFRSPPGISEESSTASASSPKPRSARDVMSSIDAFEASFNTSFPSSFSSQKEEEKQGPVIYNPFFSSPARSPARPRSIDTTANEEEPSTSLQERLANARASPGGRSVGDQSTKSQPQKQSKDPPARYESPARAMNMNNNLPTPTNSATRSRSFPSARIFPATSPKETNMDSLLLTPDRKKTGTPERDELKTPPHSAQKSPDDVEQPRRPEKTVSVVARARYENALQPRNLPVNQSVGRLRTQPTDPAMSTPDSKQRDPSAEGPKKENKSDSGTKASLVLKRLQQRRVKERMAGEASPASSASLPPTQTNSSSSPSVSSVVSSYEAAVKRQGDKIRPQPQRKFSARTNRSPSPMSAYPPSDEEDIPTKGQERARELQHLARRTAENGMKKPTELTPDPGFVPRSSKPMSAETIRAEIRNLDAIANSYPQPSPPVSTSPPGTSSSRFNATGKLKRNVRQPMSYAEPSLSSKLRRGDIYFAKEKSDAAGRQGDELMNDMSSNPIRS